MRAFGALIACVFSALLVITTAHAVDHPANGQRTNEVSADYGTEAYGFPKNWSKADLTFGSSYPAVKELVPPEKYMLAGTVGNKKHPEGMPAWIKLVSDFCLDYLTAFGQLPTELNEDTVSKLRNQKPETVTPLDNALLFNPMTGELPRLDSSEFSMGDVYARRLSRDEMMYFASKRPALADEWFNGRYHDIETGRIGKVKLESDVLYIRAYGMNGVIYEDLVYRLSEPDYNSSVSPVVVSSSPRVVRYYDDWSTNDDSGCAPSG